MMATIERYVHVFWRYCVVPSGSWILSRNLKQMAVNASESVMIGTVASMTRRRPMMSMYLSATSVPAKLVAPTISGTTSGFEKPTD